MQRTAMSMQSYLPSGNNAARGYNSACRDHRTLFYHCTIHHHGTHADKNIILDGAGMEYASVTYFDIAM